MKPKKLPVTIEQEVKKAHEAVAITPKSGESLTLLGRKMYNIMLFHAQKQGVTTVRYRVPLKEISSDAEFDSNDTQLIKRYLKQMAASTVEWYSSGSSGRSWEVTSLISSAKLEEQGGTIWISWSYDESIKARLLAPEMYARISLQLQAQFRSASSLALYEVGSRYADNPGGVTMRKPWEWWRPVLTGTPDNRAVAYLEYKYFKRDVIKPALRELNFVADINMELIEHKNGRRVVDVQFSVVRKAQAGLPLQDMNILDLNLLSRMVKLGLSQKEAENIYTKIEEPILRATVENTEARIKRNPPLDSPAAYFKDAIKKGYVKYAPQKTSLLQVAPPLKIADSSKDKPSSSLDEKRLADAQAMFFKLDQEGQETKIKEWYSSAPNVIQKKYNDKGLQGKIVQMHFLNWFAKETLDDL